MDRRLILIVLDSVGIGAAPDAAEYGDSGSNTLGHLAEKSDILQLPNLEQLGLGLIDDLHGFKSVRRLVGSFGRLNPRSAGKDTTTGHWEIAGLILDQPFPTYPDGFPADLINIFESAIGRPVLGNCVASGTEIIQRLGAEHYRTGAPIVYTSADSVFQIAAHEQIIPLPQLYEICRTARDILQPPHGVGRVIARPFNGTMENWQRTANRKDFSLEPSGVTILDHAAQAGLDVRAVGKIRDIYAGRGVSKSFPSKSNAAGIKILAQQLQEDFNGLLMVNLVDFDMLYGHRNDVRGYAQALMAFDRELPDLLAELRPDDLLMITADHGCDPTFPGTDHTRESVPLLVSGPSVRSGVNLHTRDSFSDIAATGAAWLDLPATGAGASFLDLLL